MITWSPSGFDKPRGHVELVSVYFVGHTPKIIQWDHETSFGVPAENAETMETGLSWFQHTTVH